MSLSAKTAVSLLREVKKLGLIPGIDKDLNREFEKAREYNRKHQYKEPSDQKAPYKTHKIGGYPTLVIRPGAGREPVKPDHNKVILFLRGGGDRDTWKPEVSFARTYAKCAEADVFYPIYPPFSEVSVKDTADLIYRIYSKIAEKYSAQSITVVGNSYGGFLALQLVTWINRKGNDVDMLGLMILNSPFAFPETEEEWGVVGEYEKTDPMMPEGAVRFMMDGVTSADPETPDYALYPGKMDFHHAPETYVFYMEEACACVSETIRKAYERGRKCICMLNLA